ncbi:transport system kinase [Mycobacterium lentiflavum]|uniref:Transport system kinase n=1 Tax=Mycobacterium lentiflavum TaxID=141349 RepID=A0A0E4H2W4_MYCLN|nr:methylmalonyl Co-A mutase-associated GTPase MeaB [Mycobacterium lentiflavum]CQD23917.1 transport system kinase [Mycobacterium lentiflavum]
MRTALRPHTGTATVVGLTGPPGAGKSSLIAAMVTALRSRDTRVAVVAVDPSSPISGGAVLGDRTRMVMHTVDDGVFIRAVASRGQPGGLARAVPSLVDALDAAGWPVILLETVGAGQSDTEIAEIADVTVLVSVPGLGDDLHAIKAGMLELADVLVVNKCDLPGAENTARQLERAIRFRTPNAARPPVIRTSATDATGIDALLDAVKGTVRADGQRLRTRRELLHAVEAEFSRRLRQIPLDEECAAVRAGRRQIDEIVTELLAPLNCPLSGESPDRSDA